MTTILPTWVLYCILLLYYYIVLSIIIYHYTPYILNYYICIIRQHSTRFLHEIPTICVAFLTTNHIGIL